MEVLLGILYALIGIGAVLIIRNLTTLFHELGHAIPALLFTDKSVRVFVGTYGDISNGFTLRLGRLILFLRLNLFDWKIGMCQHEGEVTFTRRLLILLGGPIASLLISVPLLIYVFNNDLSPLGLTAVLIFVIAAVFDFLTNIIPVNSPLQMYDGSVSYNDGMQLVRLIARSKLSEEYLALEKLYEEKKYDELIRQARAGDPSQDPLVHHLLVQSLFRTGASDEVLTSYQEYKKHHKLSNEDYYLLGRVFLRENQAEEALKYFNICYVNGYQSPDMLNDLADTKIRLGRLNEAHKHLNAALHYAPGMADALVNRGLIHTQTEQHRSALEDFSRALAINEEFPRAHYFLAKLYEKEKQLTEAIHHYTRALELGFSHNGLAYKIELLRERQV